MQICRRSLLHASALAVPAVALAGCGIVTRQTVNGVTTVTVDVARLDGFGQAFLNGTTLIAGLPGIVGTAPAMAVTALAPVISADMKAFDAAAGGKLTMTFDATSVPSAIKSLADDGRQLLADAKAALPNVAKDQVATANTYVNAVETLVSLFQAAIGGVPTMAAAALAPDSEARALAVLGVK